MTDVPTRRGVLTAFLAPSGHAAVTEAGHISSAIVSVLPARRDEVMQRLADVRGAEVHHRSASKLVVVLEGETSGALGALLAEIAGWPGVLSANMVFEQKV
jgi:nitrate reductase NapD